MTTRLYDWNYEVIDIGPRGDSRIVIACAENGHVANAAYEEAVKHYANTRIRLQNKARIMREFKPGGIP